MQQETFKNSESLSLLIKKNHFVNTHITKMILFYNVAKLGSEASTTSHNFVLAKAYKL